MSEFEKKLPDLEAYILNSFKEWGIPGGGVVVLQDGKILLNKGYGSKEVGKNDPIDENTVFAIGSNTKSFVAAAIGILVDEGKVQWDDKVIQYLPDFAVGDPWVTQNLRIRDILCHNTGLGRNMHIFYHGEFTSEDAVHKMRYMKPVAEFRTRFGYNNYHYVLAGLLIKAISGQNWEEFIQEKIFAPLNMISSTTNLTDTRGQQNITQAHILVEEPLRAQYTQMIGEVKIMPWVDLGSQPAGGINSTHKDMINWMKMLLHKGEFEGKQILSQQTVQEMTRMQFAITNPEESDVGVLAALNPQVNYYGYGLGWFVLDYKGYSTFMHAGQVPGMNSIEFFIPALNVAILVWVNVYQSVAYIGLGMKIMDLLIDGTERDWDAEYLQIARYMQETENERVRKLYAERDDNLKQTLPLDAYCGNYENDMMGKMTISRKGEGLFIQYGKNLIGPLTHWQADTFVAGWELEAFDPDFMTFEISEGRVLSMQLQQSKEILQKTV
jgi:CubicO group peptidase (beta-lactamase class C family)